MKTTLLKWKLHWWKVRRTWVDDKNTANMPLGFIVLACIYILLSEGKTLGQLFSTFARFSYTAEHYILQIFLEKSSLYCNLQISTVPQKQSHGNQLIHRCLTRTKSIGRGQDPESQAGKQTVRWLWRMVFGVEMGREVWRRGWIRIEFAKEQCFQFPSKSCREMARGEERVSS